MYTITTDNNTQIAWNHNYSTISQTVHSLSTSKDYNNQWLSREQPSVGTVSIIHMYKGPYSRHMVLTNG